MIVLEKYDCITFYSINLKYFNKFNKVSCRGGGGSYWRTSDLNTYKFKYDLNFNAKDEQSGESVIEYKSRMICIVKIENEKKDALQMLHLIKEFHKSRNLFIENNSLSHFSKLYLYDYQITNHNIEEMENSIAHLKDMKRPEDKSEREIEEDQEIEDIEIEVRVNKIKITNDKKD